MEKNTKKFAIGAAIAGGIGYLAGILTAPKSGKETRTDVKNAAVKVKLEAEKELKKLYTEVTEQIDKAKDLAKQIHSDHKNDLEKLTNSAVNAKVKIKQILTNIHDGDVEDKDLKRALKDVNDAVAALKTFVSKNTK